MGPRYLYAFRFSKETRKEDDEMGMDDRRLGRIGRPELITGLVLWLIVGVIIFTSGYMPFWVDKSPGPRLMPIIIAGCMAILAILYWIEAYRAGGKGVKFPDIAALKKPAAFIALSFLVFFLWEGLGSILTILVVGFLELKLMERHSWLRSFLAASVMCLFAWVVFQVVLGIPLPLGIFK
jgi:hypothetical protein